MKNKDTNNTALPTLTEKVTNWHYARNLISGASAKSQTGKLLEEFTELVAAQVPDKSPSFIYDTIVSILDDLYDRGRIKTVKTADAEDAFSDALGDMYVVQVNLAEREGLSMENCIQQSWKEIEHRKGVMQDGVFVKEGDM